MYLVSVQNPDNMTVYRFIIHDNSAISAFVKANAAMRKKGFDNAERYCNFDVKKLSNGKDGVWEEIL